MPRTSVEVERVISASPAEVYALVSDVAGIGRLSSEATGATVDGGPSTPLRVGDVFTGHNRRGRRRWSTRCTVTAADPGREFGFEVQAARMQVANWHYRLEEAEAGTRVTQSWRDRRGRAMRLLSLAATGVADRAGENERSMRATLAGIQALLGPAAPGRDHPLG